jgi:hypothetical protein
MSEEDYDAQFCFPPRRKIMKPIHIALDFDKTLCTHQSDWDNFDKTLSVGSPITIMVKNLKRWLADGHKVSIFTARVSPKWHSPQQIVAARAVITDFLQSQGITQHLDITSEKEPCFSHIIDDRAYHVLPNEGKIFPYPDDLL